LKLDSEERIRRDEKGRDIEIHEPGEIARGVEHERRADM
jgi:hypothetical protein